MRLSRRRCLLDGQSPPRRGDGGVGPMEIAMWQDMPVVLRFPFVFAVAMAVVVAMTSIAATVFAPGFNALVPISLCFITIGMLGNAIAQQNRRIVELERRLSEFESHDNLES